MRSLAGFHLSPFLQVYESDDFFDKCQLDIVAPFSKKDDYNHSLYVCLCIGRLLCMLRRRGILRRKCFSLHDALSLNDTALRKFKTLKLQNADIIWKDLKSRRLSRHAHLVSFYAQWKSASPRTFCHVIVRQVSKRGANSTYTRP